MKNTANSICMLGPRDPKYRQWIKTSPLRLISNSIKNSSSMKHVNRVSFIYALFVFFLLSFWVYPHAARAQDNFAGYRTSYEVRQFSGVHEGVHSFAAQQEEWSMARKFWLSFGFGPGYTIMKADDQLNKEMNISGVSLIGELGLGIYINDNQVIYFESFAQTLSNPTYKYGGTEISMADNLSVMWSGGGLGFGNYFEPGRFLFKASVGVDRLSIEEEYETIAETKSGIYGSVAIEKEWLISKKVALGVSVHGSFGTMKDKEVNGYASKWKVFGVGATANLTWVPRGLQR